MDLTVAAKAVAGPQALGAARELGVGAGGGLLAGIIKRIRAGRDAYPAGQDQAVVHCRTSCE